jgi:protein-disulfide isomerase
MPSGKQSKKRRQAARVPTPPRIVTQRRARQASPRILIGAGVALVLVVAAVVLPVWLTRGGSSSSSNVPARGSLANALPGAADVQRLLKGIPQRGNVLGSAQAPVTMVEYIDLQCPFCREFEAEVLPALVTKYVKPGKLKIEARPIAFIGPDSERGRDTVIAAGDQHRFFNVAQLLYLNQGTENTGWLDESMVQSAAASIPGLAVPRLLDDRKSSAVKKQAKTFDKQSDDDGVKSTPTILVGKSGSTPKQVRLASPTDAKSVTAAIDRALA